jgi:hypothetical protein
MHLASLLIEKVLPWGLAIVLIREISESARILSGSETLWSAWLEFSSHLRVTRGFAFIFGGMGFLYGFQQQRLRHREEAQFLARISRLEQQEKGS